MNVLPAFLCATPVVVAVTGIAVRVTERPPLDLLTDGMWLTTIASVWVLFTTLFVVVLPPAGQAK